VLNNEKLHVKVNSVILRIFENAKDKRNLKEEYENYKSILQKYEVEFEKIRTLRHEIGNEIDNVEDEIKIISEEVEKSVTYLHNVLEEKCRKAIDEFNEKLNDIYGKLVFPLPYKLALKNGSMFLDNGSSIRTCSVEEIGFSDKRLVDIALWATILIINHEKNVLNVSFGMIDDIFENIDNNEIKRKDNLFSLLKYLDHDFQLIIFSINKQVNKTLQLPIEKPLSIQTKLHAFPRSVI